MLEDNASEGESITEGLIITILKDIGPENVYNSSPLNENETYNMVLKAITAIGSDVREGMEFGEIRSYGPMPTGKDPFLSLAFIFFLPTIRTTDERIARHGRLVAFWIITSFASTLRYFGIIKRTIRRILHMYHIKTAEDLENAALHPKIDEKIQIIESGIESFYLSEENQFESFLDLSLVPVFSPIMMIDASRKKINILIRKKTTPGEKHALINLVNEYKSKLPKRSLYKVKTITDPLSVQNFLSKAGFQQEALRRVPFQLSFSDQLTYSKLDTLIDDLLFLRKNRLIKLLLDAIENHDPVNMKKFASESDLPLSFIRELLETTRREGFLFDISIEND